MKLGSDEDIDFGLGTATADRLGLVPPCHMPIGMWRYVYRSRASVARAAPVAFGELGLRDVDDAVEVQPPERRGDEHSE